MVSELNLNDHARSLVDALRDTNLTLITAESCTGGMLASLITQISGASDVFDRGFVTYSNQSKIDHLHVSKDTLDTHGAVSAQVATEMVLGALGDHIHTVTISITGIAGPDGGTDDKPVGTVFIGVAMKSEEDIQKDVQQYSFMGDREAVRVQSCDAAITMIMRMI